MPIEKSKKVIEEFPESRYVNQARLLMSKARYYRSDYDLAIADLKVIIRNSPNKIIEEAKYWQALCKWKKGSPAEGESVLFGTALGGVLALRARRFDRTENRFAK